MFVYIDESGIHTQDGKSTVAFVFVTVGLVNKLELAILNTEKLLGIRVFHWSKQNWKIRHEFLARILKEDFLVHAVVLNNPFTEDKWAQSVKSALMGKGVKTVIIDGKKSRQYTLRLKKNLRLVGVSVKKVRTGNDNSFPILRLADFFAGLIRTHFEFPQNKEGCLLYKKAKNKLTTQFLGGQVPTSF